jgi:DNA polymerase eta
VEDQDHRLPKTITIHHRHGGSTKSRQAQLPATKEMNKGYLFLHALSLWRGIEAEGRAFPANNISVAISGFGDVEDGIQGIEGFLVPQNGNSTRPIGNTDTVTGKRKRDDPGIARFFPKMEDVSENVVEEDVKEEDVGMDMEETYLCSRCQKHIPIQEMDFHDDYHVALELSKESPARTGPVTQTKSKRSSKEGKKVPKKKDRPIEKGQTRLEFGL